MVYTAPTDCLPEQLRSQSVSIIRKNGATCAVKIDPEGLLHLQATRLYIDMTSAEISKTVPITSAFFKSNPGLAESLIGTAIAAPSLPTTVQTKLNDVWTTLLAEATAEAEVEVEVEVEAEAAPEPTSEPAPDADPEPVPEPAAVKSEPDAAAPEATRSFNWW